MWPHVCLLQCTCFTNSQCTWSNSCLPVVLGRMANSSSASIVVTRTFICQGKDSHWDKGGKCPICVTEGVTAGLKATIMILFVLRGYLLVLWQQNDQKEHFLHSSVQPGASNRKRLVGTTIKKWSPYFRPNWEHGVHYMMQKLHKIIISMCG